MCSWPTVLLLGLVFTGPAAVAGPTVAVFDNPTYVDTAASLEATLSSQGISFHTFSGITAADFTNAARTANLILFPNLTNSAKLATDLTPAAVAALRADVAGGTGLIATGGSAHVLLNRALGWTLTSTVSGGPSFLDHSAAAGTAFANLPSQLTVTPEPGTSVNPFNFLPPGAVDLYRDEVNGGFNGSRVFEAPFGNGKVGYLAWDFANAVPTGDQDGGWVSVLGATVNDVAGPLSVVPEPASLTLCAVGGFALAVRSALRRRKESRAR
jgi:hypothetical protein